MAAREFLRVLRAFAFKKNFYREDAKSAKKCQNSNACWQIFSEQTRRARRGELNRASIGFIWRVQLVCVADFGVRIRIWTKV
jgi:hypothetical protein